LMSVEERKVVAETVIKQVNGRVPVIVHVGCVAVRDAVKLARHAQQARADGVSSILPPLYGSIASLSAYFTQIAEAAPNLPLLSYVAGGPTNATALMQTLMQIPNVTGIKYTGPNMYELKQIIELRRENWSVFSGMDEQCVFAAMFGVNGNIGSTLNFMPGVYREIHKGCRNGDFDRGRTLQLQANEVTRVLSVAGFMGALKAVMLSLGFDCGKPRLPNLPLPADKREQLYDQLAETESSRLIRL
jgi:N-acetylneuraminate lyase